MLLLLATLCCPLLLLSSCCASWLLCVASVALSSCTALLSSHRTGWLLRVASHMPPYPFALPSRPLVAPAGCVCCMPLLLYLVALPSCPLVVPASRCVSHSICHPIPLHRPLILLLLALPMSTFHVAPPSHPLVASAGCCLSCGLPIVLCFPLVITLCRLCAACRAISVATVIISCVALLSSRRVG